MSESSEKVKDSPSNGPAPPAKGSLWDKLAPWISNNLRSTKSWKVLLRCWAAAWVSFVIMLPNKSLQQLGNTAFFALLVAVMVPPGMPVQIFFFTMAILVLGLALGWALSCAAMAAALAARNQILLKQTLQKEAQSAAGLANPDALFRNAIFNGVFLDTDSTVVFGVFFGFGTFCFALVRAYAPKLTLMSVFGTIALDIFCSYGPLFPFAQYTLLNSMLTSVACYIAIALVFIVFVFPETLSHSYLDSSAALLQKLTGLLVMQEEVLSANPPDILAGTPLAGRIAGTRAAALMQLEQLNAQKHMLNLEFSWGRWSAGDVQGLLEPMSIVVVRLGALSNFRKLMTSSVSVADSAEDDGESVAESTVSSASLGDTYLLRQFRERNTAAEVQHHVRLVDILPNIREATAGVRTAAVGVLDVLQRLIVAVNTKRYGRGHSEQDAIVLELDEALSALRNTLDDFKNERRLVLLQPFLPLFASADAGEIKNVPLRALHIAFVFTSNLVSLCGGIIALAEYVSNTAAKRPKATLWMPNGLHVIGTLLRSRRGSGEDATGEDTAPEEEVELRNKRKYRLDADSKPPENAMQRVANLIHKLYKWTKTPEALFTFRYVVVSIALWLPQVIQSSAHISYAERGVWALIMAQTTLNIYASDQIFNYAMRIGGTFIGALVGMVCWYIGCGNGTGNPYGIAAATGVFLLPIIFLRLFAPPQHMIAVMLGGVTFVLVVGYSWIDGNLTVFASVGQGWSVAWRRFILVMIGSAASFILMMIPPKSGRKAVRIRNASVLSSLSYLYSHLTSLWLAAGEPFETSHKVAEVQRHWPKELREMMITLSQQLQDLRVRTAMSKWEGNIRGHWPFEDYDQLLDIQSDILSSMILMASGLMNMDSHQRKAALPHTFVLNPHFISDAVSMFFLVSQSLRTGEPLHEAHYKNLTDRLHYHATTSVVVHTDAGALARSKKAHRQSIMSYEYMFYATAVVAVLEMSHDLNELRTVVASLCGEVPLEGFVRWREEYDRSHTLV